MSLSIMMSLYVLGLLASIIGVLFWKGKRRISVIFLIVLFMGGPVIMGPEIDKAKKEELAEKKNNNPESYLEEIKKTGDVDLYKRELFDLYPEKYEEYLIKHGSQKEILNYYKNNNMAKYLIKLSELIRTDEKRRYFYLKRMKFHSRETYDYLVEELSTPLLTSLSEIDASEKEKLLGVFRELSKINPDNEEYVTKVVELTGELEKEKEEKRLIKEEEEKRKKELEKLKEVDRLYKKVKKIPASNIKDNMTIYSKLHELEPGNRLFKRKLDHYSKLYLDAGPKMMRKDTSPSKLVTSGDVIDHAFAMCTAMEATGMISECEVSGWKQSVEVRIDTTGPEAAKICSGVVGMMSQYSRKFQGKWKLVIYSPFSGNHPLATCVLR